MSSYEEKIIEVLRRDKIDFEREKRFSDLKGGKYRYDFYVYGAQSRNCIIEVNGEQHYRRVSKFHRSRADFERAKERDRRKISYALANNIPIYIIPFWEIENIKTSSDIFQEKFRARDKWKNDRDFSIYSKFDGRGKI